MYSGTPFFVASFKCSNCPLGECLVVSHVGYEKCAALGFKLRILPSSLFSSDKVLLILIRLVLIFLVGCVSTCETTIQNNETQSTFIARIGRNFVD